MEHKINLQNVKMIRKYLVYLKEAPGLHKDTIIDRMTEIAHYEKFINWRDFKVFNEKIAIEYKRYWIDYKKSNGQSYIKKTVQNKLKAIRELYLWLYLMPGYRSHINPLHIKYLKLDKKTLNALATSNKFKKTPTFEEAQILIRSISNNSEIDRRDRALIAFTLLTGIRAKTLITLKIGDVDLKKYTVKIDFLEGTDTKFGKSNIVCILPYDQEYTTVIEDWINELINVKGFKYTDPLFPMTAMNNSPGTYCLSASKVKPMPWKSIGAVEKIFKDRAIHAKLPYYTPQGFRRLHYQHGRKYATNMEQQSALSQNISHSTIEVSETNYGYIDPPKRFEILSKMRFDKSPEELRNDESSKLNEIYDFVKTMKPKNIK